MTDKPIVLSVPAELKGAWIAASRAQGMKLSDWIIQKVGVMDYDFNGFSLNIAVFVPFERYVRALPDADARALFKRVRDLNARQVDAVAALKIVSTYLEKRMAIADGIADRELFHDINADALGYFAAAPELTHTDLIAVLADAT
ncbi:hypothetical protein [Comamonas terrigena]|nr:hypothetical protein [Comamonas terrigena]BBL25454.1 hypothetical protein CT3_29090 [Comamonas terrigena NBRC 13299]SUY70972.1 Uncharacterised protein [Comamonas terrigena]